MVCMEKEKNCSRPNKSTTKCNEIYAFPTLPYPSLSHNIAIIGPNIH